MMNHDENDIFQHVGCSFILREDAEGGLHRFTPISVRGPRGDGALHCTVPPSIGDTVFLSANDPHFSGYYRVVERQWTHASWGSAIWPIGQPIQPDYGVSLDLLVERSVVGWYITEAPRTDEDDDE